MLDQLLDEVEWGGIVRIMRGGKPIAHFMPDADARRAEVAEPIERLKGLREEVGRAPLDEASRPSAQATSADRA